MTKSKNLDGASVQSFVRQRYQDQIDADGAAEAFLIGLARRFQPMFATVKWWNLEDDDGRAGALLVSGRVVASVTVTRDQMNWSEVCGVAFV